MNTFNAAVRTDLLEELEKRIEKKINRPARKLKLSEAVVEYGEAYPRFFARRPAHDGGGYFEVDEEAKAKRDARGVTTHVIEFTPVKITASEAKLKGWKFIATIEHTEAGNIIRRADDSNINLPEKYRSNTNVCDHCKTNRRRKDTYIVQSDGFGEYCQVGRNCIKDFLGHGDPSRVAAYFDNVLSLYTDLVVSDEYFDDEYFVRAPRTTDTPTFLAVVAQSILAKGWTARSAHTGEATADNAWGWLFDPRRSSSELLEHYGFDSITNEARAAAAAAREWAVNNDLSSNEYLYNLKIACSLSTVVGRRTGLVASAVSSHQRYLGQLASRKAEAERTQEALPVPVTDKRIRIEGVVVGTKWQNGYAYDSPPVLKITVQTTEGWKVWGTAASSLDGVAIGDVVSFDAKVTPANDNPKFGFASRPTKAEFVSRKEDDQQKEVAA